MDGRRIKKILLIFLLLSNSLFGQNLSRRILALYDSERGQTARKNHIHANAEMVLNHLGCIVDYWDIQQGLPNRDAMQKYRGVLTWFYGNGMKNSASYLQWAAEQIANGRRYVILGNIGAFKETRTGEFLQPEELNAFTRKLGFVIDNNNWTVDPAQIELVSKNSEMVEFERSLDYELTNYEKYQSIDPDNRVYLKLKRSDLPNSESHLVLTSAAGGFAASGYVLYENQNNYTNKWRLNPFKFFNAAFALQELPRPDVTTINGLRIWCSHVDGDALVSKSEVKTGAWCGEIIRDEIFKKYRWPFSVSVVVGELADDDSLIAIARSIYEFNWVEAASHSLSHPFYWDNGYQNKNRYVSRNLPIPGYDFDLKKEIIGSVDFINNKLLTDGKKVKQFFWTGNCEATVDAMKLCEQLQIKNINGGDSVFDKNNPSYTSIAPLSVQVGNYRQIYAPNANENIYTNNWQGPFYGFKSVLETFKNTESPVRIRPIDIYFHFYSGEKWASLNALKAVMEATITQPVSPIFISEYLAIVQGFFSTNIKKIDSNSWEIADNGACKTIRFDDTEQFPDLEKSQNVLGFDHYQGALYVFLNDQNKSIIVLTDNPSAMPYLKQASHTLKSWSVQNNNISFEVNGYGKGEFLIANLVRNQQYNITIKDADLNSFIQKSSINGALNFLYPIEGRVAVQINPVENGN